MSFSSEARERFHVSGLATGNPRFEPVDDPPRRLDADVRAEEDRLDILDQGIVDGRPCADDLGDPARDRAAGPPQRIAEAPEQPLPQRCFFARIPRSFPKETHRMSNGLCRTQERWNDESSRDKQPLPGFLVRRGWPRATVSSGALPMIVLPSPCMMRVSPGADSEKSIRRGSSLLEDPGLRWYGRRPVKGPAPRGAVRIIAGRWRRRVLPVAGTLRPTPDRVREDAVQLAG